MLLESRFRPFTNRVFCVSSRRIVFEKRSVRRTYMSIGKDNPTTKLHKRQRFVKGLCRGGGTVDTQVSGTCGVKPVEVRVLFSAPVYSSHLNFGYVAARFAISRHLPNKIQLLCVYMHCTWKCEIAFPGVFLTRWRFSGGGASLLE